MSCKEEVETIKEKELKNIDLDELDSDSTTQNQQTKETEQEAYKADILLIKNSAFEAKLFSKLLTSLGYTFEIATSVEELNNLISTSKYKIIIFDEECEELNIEELSKSVKASNEKTGLTTNLILISDQENEDNENLSLYVQEIIKNVVNKDSLKRVFEKFI